jgi:hypothetical protein
MTNQDTSACLTGLPSLCSMPKSGARFGLRKRSIRDDQSSVNLSSYNSDFLSGLFADVAKVNVLSELRIQVEATTADVGQTRSGERSSFKKRRVSISHCDIRAPHQSCKNLFALSPVVSPTGIAELFGCSSSIKQFSGSPSVAMERRDSLAFQLHCVSSTEGSGSEPMSDSPKPSKTIMDVGKMAFPHLPATVSDSSCSAGLTREKLDRHASNTETELRDSFGWFVDLEGDSDSPAPQEQHGGHYSVSRNDVAFQAPKRVDAAEVEWAKAADTIDDVLGDFF